MRKLVSAIAIALILLSAIPAAPADNDSLKVLVLVENKDFSVGTGGNVTVLVYDKGIPVDPDTTPDVTIGTLTPRVIQVFKYGNGVFIGNFTIQASDVFLGTLVTLQATATLHKGSDNSTYNRDTDAATIYLEAAPSGTLALALHATGVSDSVLRAGARVTVTAEVTAAGSPVQPASINFTAEYPDPDGVTHSEAFDATALSIGRYEGTYSLPAVPYEVELTIRARAATANETAAQAVRLGFNQLWVVYHNSSRTANSTTFYLYVGDPAGNPVAGARFDARYYPDGNLTRAKAVPEATTDAGGKARVTLDFDAGTRSLYLSGRVNGSGKSQSFSGRVDVSADNSGARPSGTGFEMVFTGDPVLYAPGKKLSREYSAFNNTQAWKNADIYTLIVAAPYSADNPVGMTPTTLIEGRPYTTDAGGRLTITFTPPSWDCYVLLYFKTATGIHPKPSGYFFNHDSNDGQYYSEAYDVFLVTRVFSGSGVSVQVSPYKTGAPATVKATLGGAAADLARASWVAGDFDPYSLEGQGSGGWQVWTSIDSYLNRTSVGFTGTVTIPKFMPGDVKYSVVVFVQQGGSAFPQYGSGHMTPEAAGTTGGGSFPLMYLVLFIIVIAAVAGAAGGLAVRRRRRAAAAAARPPAGVQKTINCPSCGTPFTVVQGAEPVKIQCPRCGKAGTLPPASGAAAPAPAAPGPAQAAPPPAPSGVRMSVPCPDCGTVFEIVRLTTPTRIQCPRCGKAGTLPPLTAEQVAAAQQMQPAPAGQAMQAQPAPDMPVSEPVVQTKTIACPRCRQQFNIEKKEGPQEIRCPHCGKEGTIGRAPAPQPPAGQPAPPPGAPPAPSPAGMYGQPAPAQYAPAAAAAGPVPAGGMPMYAQQAQRPAPAQAPGKLITCPACRMRFPVSDPRRPIQVRCPNCGKEGTLRI